MFYFFVGFYLSVSVSFKDETDAVTWYLLSTGFVNVFINTHETGTRKDKSCFIPHFSVYSLYDFLVL